MQMSAEGCLVLEVIRALISYVSKTTAHLRFKIPDISNIQCNVLRIGTGTVKVLKKIKIINFKSFPKSCREKKKNC